MPCPALCSHRQKTSPAQFTLLALGKCIIPWACSASAVRPCNELLTRLCWLQAQTWPTATERRDRRNHETDRTAKSKERRDRRNDGTDGTTKPTERRNRRNDEIDGTAIQAERQERRNDETDETIKQTDRRNRRNDEIDRTTRPAQIRKRRDDRPTEQRYRSNDKTHPNKKTEETTIPTEGGNRRDRRNDVGKGRDGGGEVGQKSNRSARFAAEVCVHPHSHEDHVVTGQFNTW